MKRIFAPATALWIAAWACACMDLSLLDDMLPLDAGEPADTSGEGSEDEDGENDPDNEDGDGDDDDTDSGEEDPIDTDPNDVEPPVAAPAACGPDEVTTAHACVASGPASVSLRFVTNEPASVEITVPDPVRAAVLSEPLTTEHHGVAAGLDGQAEVAVTVSLEDVNGNRAEMTLPVMGLGGPAVAITEVLADPNGTEPNQEFVEIVNIGALEVDLSGWMIDDNNDQDGDLIPAGSVLASGRVAVIVSGAYDPGEGQDPPPDPGALMVVLDSSIGTSGLKNSEAESVELYDATGVLMSRYAGQAGKPVAGCSAVRVHAELPDGDLWAFDRQPNGTSTPGTVPVLP